MTCPNLPETEDAELLDYIAGLVDSDGSIFISQGSQCLDAGGTPSHRLCTTVVTTNRDLAAWLQEVLGGRFNDVGRNEEHHLRRWRWERTRASAADLLGELQDRLVVKARQAVLGQRFREERSQWPRGRALTEEELRRRDRWQETLSRVNRLQAVPGPLTERLTGNMGTFENGDAGRSGRKLAHPLTETDRAYLAGLFDGDGGIDLAETSGAEGPSPRHRLALHVTTSSESLARCLAERFGGSVRTLEGEAATRPSYKAEFDRVRVMLRFIRAVLPHSVRAGELELAEDFLKATHPYGTGGPGGTVPEEVIEWRRALQEAIRRLRGYRPLDEKLVRSLAGSSAVFERRYPRARRTSEWLRRADWNEATRD